MQHALRLAARGLGRVAPNPAVGCVIVSNEGHIVGRGWTQPGGRPHAEAVALAAAGEAARGATAYVTLEPCAHLGQTPPCADALIGAGVARVVTAVTDPDSRVNGRGIAKLEAAGVAVTRDVMKDEAILLNEGFFICITVGRPLVTLKSAESADGFVSKPGAGKWITGERARAHAHLLRSRYDAIMVGIGTVLADDPMLTCRLPGMEDRSPVRVVVDTHMRLPLTSQIARTAREHPTVVFTRAEGATPIADIFIVHVTGVGERVDLPTVILRGLLACGITRVLVEGGPTLEAALLDAGLVDRVHLFRAPQSLGSGTPGIGARIAADPKFHVYERADLGPDVLESWRLKD